MRMSVNKAQIHANNWFYSMTWVGGDHLWGAGLEGVSVAFIATVFFNFARCQSVGDPDLRNGRTCRGSVAGVDSRGRQVAPHPNGSKFSIMPPASS